MISALKRGWMADGMAEIGKVSSGHAMKPGEGPWHPEKPR